MKCPDCQAPLSAVSVTGFDESFRCQVCGGFWVEEWVTNKISSQDMINFFRLGLTADPKLSINKCPKDGSGLTGVDRSLVPEKVMAKKCGKCGWWWFPADSLFDFKSAMSAKASYLKWWGKTADAALSVMPAFAVIVVAIGLGIGLFGVKQRTDVSVPASTVQLFFTAKYEGNGIEELVITSNTVLYKIEYKKVNEAEWMRADVSRENGIYRVRLMGLTEGEKYIFLVEGEEYGFETR